MRRRLLVTYLSLLAVAFLGLAGPLAVALAARGTGEMVIDRMNDTARFASLAEPALRSGHTEALRAELSTYQDLYGITAAVLRRDGQIAVASRPGVSLDQEGTVRQVRAALAGDRTGIDRIVWPWTDGPLVVVEPVGRAGEVIGAAVTISPADALRGTTVNQWCLIGIGGLLVVALGAVAAAPITTWMLRPINDLDEVTQAISDGRLDARVPADTGPPELRRLAESFNRMANTITTLLDRQRAFVSYAGHQIRNPLAALRIRVDDLAATLTADGPEAHALALDEVDRLTRVCDSLLTVAQTGTAPQTPTRLSVVAVADNRVAMWEPVAGRAGSTLLRCGATAAAAWCPDGILDQALDVLIDNALKFAGPGATIAVHVCRPIDGHVDVHVVDDGPGPPPEQLEQRATRPISRGDARPDLGGFGLGLVIVSTLLSACGGSLVLAQASPHGTDARIRLPCPADPA